MQPGWKELAKFSYCNGVFPGSIAGAAGAAACIAGHVGGIIGTFLGGPVGAVGGVLIGALAGAVVGGAVAGLIWCIGRAHKYLKPPQPPGPQIDPPNSDTAIAGRGRRETVDLPVPSDDEKENSVRSTSTSPSRSCSTTDADEGEIERIVSSRGGGIRYGSEDDQEIKNEIEHKSGAQLYTTDVIFGEPGMI